MQIASAYSTPKRGAVSTRLGPGTPALRGCEVVPLDESDPEIFTITFESGLALTTTGVLGKGGFGKVFACRTPSGDLAALKMSTRPLTEPDMRRLEEEISIMNMLKHPNIVRILDCALGGGTAFIAMERCASKTLQDLMNLGQLTTDEILWITHQLLTAVVFMHTEGVLHRDLKLQNILFDFDGNVKLTDFGLSGRITKDAPRRTILGTKLYMAPEMAQAYLDHTEGRSRTASRARSEGVATATGGASGNARSLDFGQEIDVWGIGVVTYVMMTRKSPYAWLTAQADEKPADADVLRIIARNEWRWPKNFQGHPALMSFVEYALTPDPVQRPTAAQLAKCTLWQSAPYAAPASLMQRLGLLDASGAKALTVVSANTPVQKLPIEVLLRRHVVRLEDHEQAVRTDLEIEATEIIGALRSVSRNVLQEYEQRKAIIADESDAREHLQLLRNVAPRRASTRRGSSMRLTMHHETNLVGVAPPTVNETITTGMSATRRQSSARAGSVALVTSDPVVAIVPDVAVGEVVSTHTGHGVLYEGRDSCTRWSLRRIVSLPRDSMPEEHRCLNGHIMAKLVTLPNANCLGFDCNVCTKRLMTPSVTHPVFRCAKCDFDMCDSCSVLKTLPRAHFGCVSCGKRFLTQTKLETHELNCRGVSASPGRAPSLRTDRLGAVAFAAAGGTLPISPRGASNDRLSTGSGPLDRPSTRASTGGRPSRFSVGSIGGASESVFEIQSPGANTRVSMDLPSRKPRRSPSARDDSAPPVDVSDVSSASSRSARLTFEDVSIASGRGSTAFTLPPTLEPVVVEAMKRYEPVKITAATGAKQPRSSVNSQAQEAELPVAKKHVSETQYAKAQEAAATAAASPAPRASPARGSSARRSQAIPLTAAGVETRPQATDDEVSPASSKVQSSRGGSTRASNQRASEPRVESSGNRGRGEPINVVLNIENAVKPSDVMRQPPTRPKSQSREASSARTPRGAAAPANTTGGAVVPFAAHSPMHPPPSAAFAKPASPLPLPQSLVASLPAQSLVGAAGASSPGGYLALPQAESARSRFLEDFLGGAWIRHYAFATNDVALLYYCVQPGRFGAFYQRDGVMATMVLDVHTRLVLHVPTLRNDAVATSGDAHPHVQTSYKEEANLLRIADAQRHEVLGPVVNGVIIYINELNRLRAEGLPPVYVPAAYIHQPEVGSVPRSTKFVYLRKVFPDPDNTFALFRLSNMRSHVICPTTTMDIRWQSDRANHIGLRYYVHTNGEATPFSTDHTGVLARLDHVLSTTYRSK